MRRIVFSGRHQKLSGISENDWSVMWIRQLRLED